MDVVAVGDQLHGHALVGQGGGDRAGLTAVDPTHRVAQVGQMTSAGVERGAGLRVGGVGVTDRNHDPGAR